MTFSVARWPFFCTFRAQPWSGCFLNELPVVPLLLASCTPYDFPETCVVCTHHFSPRFSCHIVNILTFRNHYISPSVHVSHEITLCWKRGNTPFFITHKRSSRISGLLCANQPWPRRFHNWRKRHNNTNACWSLQTFT